MNPSINGNGQKPNPFGLYSDSANGCGMPNQYTFGSGGHNPGPGFNMCVSNNGSVNMYMFGGGLPRNPTDFHMQTSAATNLAAAYGPRQLGPAGGASGNPYGANQGRRLMLLIPNGAVNRPTGDTVDGGRATARPGSASAPSISSGIGGSHVPSQTGMGSVRPSPATGSKNW